MHGSDGGFGAAGELSSATGKAGARQGRVRRPSMNEPERHVFPPDVGIPNSRLPY